MPPHAFSHSSPSSYLLAPLNLSFILDQELTDQPWHRGPCLVEICALLAGTNPQRADPHCPALPCRLCNPPRHRRSRRIPAAPPYCSVREREEHEAPAACLLA